MLKLFVRDLSGGSSAAAALIIHRIITIITITVSRRRSPSVSKGKEYQRENITACFISPSYRAIYIVYFTMRIISVRYLGTYENECPFNRTSCISDRVVQLYIVEA